MIIFIVEYGYTAYVTYSHTHTISTTTRHSSHKQDTSDPLTQRAEELYDTLEEVFPDDVILEDRVHHTLGARIRDTEESGYPAIILIGEKVCMVGKYRKKYMFSVYYICNSFTLFN